MKTLLKRCCSLLMLSFLLFPLVQKEWHAFEHRNDFHCSSSSAHLHEVEHNCNLCDHIFPSGFIVEAPAQELCRYAGKHNYVAGTEQQLPCFANVLRPSRAPPVLA